jgi:DMSO reductase family type II enzyme heme b subunit
MSMRLDVTASGFLAALALSMPAGAATAQQELQARPAEQPITLDGEVEDWVGIPGIVVPLSGIGGAERVELTAAIRGNRIYMLVVWDDPTRSDLHKPHKWNEAAYTYEKTDQMEDRFAISFEMSGEFSANKIGGSEFTADVWHWKADRSNRAGLAHDKWWRVSRTPFERSREFRTPDGDAVYLVRPSDAGDQLYKPARYHLKQNDLMPGYEINPAPSGSIADVQARGVWRDGRWYLELSRLLTTGHDDDVPIPAAGTIEIAVAVFDGVSNNVVDGGAHSVSEELLLRTFAPSS